MKKIKLILTIIFPVLLFNPVFAQDEESKPCGEATNKKAVKLYEQGLDKKKYERKERVAFLKQALELEPEYANALFLLAEEIVKQAKFDDKPLKGAEPYLTELVKLCPGHDPYAYFYLGQMSYEGGKYTEAAKHLELFLKDVDKVKTDKDHDLATNMLRLAKDYAVIFENPVPFNPAPVKEVSTNDDEYLAIISPDNEMMFFTRRMPEPKSLDRAYATDRQVEVFSVSNRVADIFDRGEALPPPFNQGDHYGGATITPDNKHLYLTVCKPNANGYMNCDIYSSDYYNGSWSKLTNLGPNINKEDSWDAQPSISADGRTLYFSSYRADSKGMDLYVSTKLPNGEWSPAQNMGPKINTGQNEKSPFIHSDSQTLYYSSDGLTGAGGYDIFLARANEKGEWLKPKNLGVPINTEGDEVGFFVSTDGHTGYFASNTYKSIGKGGYDIFSFDLYKEARPEQIAFIKGEVKDINGAPVKDAKVELKNPSTKQVTKVDVDPDDGKFVAVVTVKNQEDLVLSIKKDGAAFSSQLISMKDQKPSRPQSIGEMSVKTVEVGAAYTLNNINYKTNSADLTPESSLILDEFMEFLNEHSTIKIAIHGHTDDVGNDQANLSLSSDRAYSVMAYLQEKGISKDRLSFKGYGETKPLVPNISPENRAKNRRTEFMIVAK